MLINFYERNKIMGRYIGPRKKYLRRFGLLHEADEKKEIKRQKRKTAYGIRFEEKQKLKFIYGVAERQFGRYVRESLNSHEDPAVMLYRKLETRLDNVIYRLGFAATRPQARQLASHGHVLVNGARVDIPSYHVAPRDDITLAGEMLSSPAVQESLSKKKPIDLPSWLERGGGVGRVKHYPKKEEVRKDIDFENVIAFYL